MTKAEAQSYLDKTNWFVLRECSTGESVPKEIQKKRDQAYQILKKAE